MATASEHRAAFQRGVWLLLCLAALLGPGCWMLSSPMLGVWPEHQGTDAHAEVPSCFLAWSILVGSLMMVFTLFESSVRTRLEAIAVGAFYALVVGSRVLAVVFALPAFVPIRDC
ncbi:MAG: hypothetical protein ACI89X_002347 [Planctomycetota bacterium]|jgi:hypothetical protein